MHTLRLSEAPCIHRSPASLAILSIYPAALSVVSRQSSGLDVSMALSDHVELRLGHRRIRFWIEAGEIPPDKMRHQSRESALIIPPIHEAAVEVIWQTIGLDLPDKKPPITKVNCKREPDHGRMQSPAALRTTH